MPQLQLMEPIIECDDLLAPREENAAWRIGPYELREQIGQGGMASVYRAWHSGLHRFEALKVPRYSADGVDSQYIQRLLQEARLAARLRHPHIVGIHNISEDGAPHPYFSMDLVEGDDLAQHLQDCGPLSCNETIAILCQAAAALSHAHENGIVHRDIKPENILLQNCEDGGCDVKVVDFGISRAAEDCDGTRLTRSGIFVGTPEYMSPEQSGSGEVVDYRTDIYSLGVVAYEMLTGAPPFLAGDGVSRMAVLISHVRDTPRPPYEINPGISEKLSALVMRALAKNPAERFQSAAEMKRALEDISLEKTRRATTQIMPASLAPGTAAPAVPFWKSAQGGWPALVMAVGIGILIGWLMTARPTYKSAVAIAGSTPGAPHTLSPPSKSPPSKKTASQKTILPIVRKKQTLKRAIAFTRETRKSASLPLGTRKIVQTGHSGVREIVLEIAMQGRQELSRKILTTRVVSAPRKQVELLGTRAPRRAQATAAKSFTTSSASTRRRAGSTSEKSAASSRRVPKSRATFKKKSSPRKLASQKSSSRKSSSAKSSAQNSSKKARSSQDARDRSPGVVPSSQVFGSFRLPGSPGD